MAYRDKRTMAVSRRSARARHDMQRAREVALGPHFTPIIAQPPKPCATSLFRDIVESRDALCTKYMPLSEAPSHPLVFALRCSLAGVWTRLAAHNGPVWRGRAGC